MPKPTDGNGDSSQYSEKELQLAEGRVSEIEGHIAYFKNKLDQVEAKIKGEESKIKEYKSSIDSLEEKQKQARVTFSDQSSRLQEAVVKMEKDLDALLALKAKVLDQYNHMAPVQEKIKSIVGTSEALKIEKNELMSRNVDEDVIETERKLAIIENNKNYIEAKRLLRADIERLAQKQSSFIFNTFSSVTEKEMLRKEIAACEDRLTALTSEVSKLNQALIDLVNEKTTGNIRLAEIEGVLSKNAAELKSVFKRNLLFTMTGESELSFNNESTIKHIVAFVESDVRFHQASLKAADAKIKQLEEKIRFSNAASAKLNSEYQKITHDTEKEMTRIERDMGFTKFEYDDSIHDWNKERNDYASQLKEQTRLLGKERESLNEMRIQLKAYQDKVEREVKKHPISSESVMRAALGMPAKKKEKEEFDKRVHHKAEKAANKALSAYRTSAEKGKEGLDDVTIGDKDKMKKAPN